MTRHSPLKDTAMRTVVSFSVITGGVLVLLFLFTIRSIVLQLVIAVILAVALNPLTNRLLRLGLKRVYAAVVTLLVTLIVLLGVLGAIASPLIAQGDDLVKNAPHLIDRAAASPLVHKVDSQFHVTAKIKGLSKEAPKLLSTGSTPVLGALGTVFGAISTTAVILVLALFMLIEGPTLWSQSIRLLGDRQGAFVNGVAGKIITAVGGFVNGNLFISLIAGVVALVTLLVTGVPYAFALAALVALFDLIPLIGATIATVVIALVALTKGILITIIVVTVMLVYQFVEGNLIQPIVYGKAVQLSQLLIVVATLVGGLLGGIIGILLAIPIAAALQIIAVEVLRANGAPLEPEVAQSVTKQ